MVAVSQHPRLFAPLLPFDRAGGRTQPRFQIGLVSSAEFGDLVIAENADFMQPRLAGRADAAYQRQIVSPLRAAIGDGACRGSFSAGDRKSTRLNSSH